MTEASPTRTPSETLTAAADLIRDRASVAAPAPWRDVQDGWCIRSEPSSDRASWRTVACEAAAQSAWICLLSPAVAPHLEAILRQAALAYELRGDTEQDENALGLARALLGDTEETTYE